MVVASTVRYFSTEPSQPQTLATGLLTPAADSLWIIVAVANNNNHTAAKSWAVTGGSEPKNLRAALSMDDNATFPLFAWSVRAWTQQHDASPAARVTTVDAWSGGAEAGFYGLTIVEVTGHDQGSPIIREAANYVVGGGVADVNTTTTFGAAPSGYQLLIGNSETDGGALGFDAAPSGFTTVGSETSAGGWFGQYVADSITNTTAAITHGTASGTNYHYALLALELAEASAGPGLVQSRYRWGLDDGTESAHTFDAAENTPVTLTAGQARLLRIQLDETAGATETIKPLIQYRRVGEPDTEWRNLTP